MKFLLYSDMHLQESNLKVCSVVMKEILTTWKERKADYVINLGDTFHERGMIKTKCFDFLYQERCIWHSAGMKHIDLIGNHDQADKAGKIHPMKIFREFGWYVFDRPIRDEELKIWFFPYMTDLNKHLPPKKEREGYDCLVHADIRGASTDTGIILDEGVNPIAFRGFKNVWSGHYHTRQRIKGTNIRYVGSPYQQNFGERGQKKGVILYDQTENKMEFIEIKGTPKYFDASIGWNGGKMEVTVPEHDYNDHLRVNIKGTSEQVNSVSRDQLKKLECHAIKIRRSVEDKMFSRLDIKPEETSDMRSMAEKYLDYINPDLDRKKLMEVYEELTNAIV